VRKLGTAQRQSLEAATAKYATNLHLASDYLTGRGFTDLEKLRRFRLGVVVDPEPGHETYRGRLAIPYLTVAGPVDIKFRCIRHANCKTAGCVKYLGLDGAGRQDGKRPKVWLYNAQAVLDDADVIVITEGELDAVAVETIANLPAAGQPGSTVWKMCPHWPRIFDGHRAIVVADGDDAGLAGAREVAATLDDALVVAMPPGEDTNSFLAKSGPDAFYERLGL
jgi:hypothetical protein